ncbi:MAG: glutamate synthase large subunit, partial [bacterium]
MNAHQRDAPTRLLHRAEFERDSCGFGLIAQMDDRPSHRMVVRAVRALARLGHRGGVGADPRTGDGCGLSLKMPRRFMRRVAAEQGFELPPRFASGLVFLDRDDARAATQKRVLAEELARRGADLIGWRTPPTDPTALGEQGRRLMPRIEQIFVGDQRADAIDDDGDDGKKNDNDALGGGDDSKNNDNASDNDDALGNDNNNTLGNGNDDGNTPDDDAVADFERRLFMARRHAEERVAADAEEFFICSLSSRVLCWKGMMLGDAIDRFYLDLAAPDLESSLAVFHQRFSTNTEPRWKLAQPFRFLAHNGEINTIGANRVWAYARRRKFEVDSLLPGMTEVGPLVSATGSDSLSLDNFLEYLWHGGIDLLRAISMMIPPAWQNVENMDEDLRAFYRYHSTRLEPWDGPAGIVLTDGRYAACAMDRNGLRPARYSVTDDRVIVLASEAGVDDAEPARVIARGRLMPGEIVAVDTATGALLDADAIRARLKTRRPWRRFLHSTQRRLHAPTDLGNESPPPDAPPLAVCEKNFQVSDEERGAVIQVLASDGKEAVGSMGDDTPIAALSSQARSLCDFFRQQFAQVTNPAIDPLRERIVMSLETCIGRKHNVFSEGASDAACLVLGSPLLSGGKLRELQQLDDPLYRHQVIDLNVERALSLPAALDRICNCAQRAIEGGVSILILSDRELRRGHWSVHALLAVGAVHQHLMASGVRGDANLIVDTGWARDPHQVATLIGFGATAVCPWLAHRIIMDMMRSKRLPEHQRTLRRYGQGINLGLHKIMARMGISTIASYRSAGLFEIIGLHQSVVERCFGNALSRLQGIGFEHLEVDFKRLADAAWSDRAARGVGGLLKYIEGGEYHACNPDVVRALHRAVASGLGDDSTGDDTISDDYRDYARAVNRRPVTTLRDLLHLRRADAPLVLDEVESESEILRRFDSAGMSLGALSPEAHEALAEAMNAIGGRSNSGEGGEDPRRYGSAKSSRIKQIASARFGVTPAYLNSAEIIQIKIAQGAKPGEGGQLPGAKVNPMIAELRYSSPGVALISPPPHHDIYSIEDLAQLVYDLKQINDEVMVSVKLVAAAGVGTIAVGVAKCQADLVTIAGYDGGTGASPLTSVKHAGVPWEMGVAETHQALCAAGLRARIRVQADGGLKTGLDVVKAAILGAESFGFGTMPMIALGCKYLRICHLNNCATGVATQHEVLRKRHFAGSPERVVAFFTFVAREVRETLATLGVRSIEELVGRTDLLDFRAAADSRHALLDLSPLLARAQTPPHAEPPRAAHRNNPPEPSPLGARMLRELTPMIVGGEGVVGENVDAIGVGENVEAIDTDENVKPIVADENVKTTAADESANAIVAREVAVVACYEVSNADRAIGARLSGLIASHHGNRGMEARPLAVDLRGVAGQSFGAWNAGGLHLRLEGEANDYVGKG